MGVIKTSASLNEVLTDLRYQPYSQYKRPEIVVANEVPWCSGLTRLPVKEEIGSSNLLGIAI
jgi:hypothetical protein